MNKKYILLGIVIILAMVLGLYKYIDDRNQLALQPGDPNPAVLGITDDLKITNEIISFTQDSGDVYQITYKYVIKHIGNYKALNLKAQAWFTEVPQNTYQITSITTNSNLKINSKFNGNTDKSLLVGDNFMSPVSQAEILVNIRLKYVDRSVQFVSFVDVAAEAEVATSAATSRASSALISSTPTTTAVSQAGVVSVTATASRATSTSFRASSYSATPVVINYNFDGLKGTTASTLSNNLTVGYGFAMRLVWKNPAKSDCVRTAVPPNPQWQGTSPNLQGYKDIVNMYENTVFYLNCTTGTYNVNAVVANRPPTSTAMAVISTPKPSSSAAPAQPVVIPVEQSSSASNERSGQVLGLYDAAQVTFSLPVGNAGDGLMPVVSPVNSGKGS